MPIGGRAIASYLSLPDIQQIRSDLTVKVSEHELGSLRLSTQAKISGKDVHEFQSEMRSVISGVTEILNDARIQPRRRLTRG